ncbi:hypothetical protein HYH02_004511 [Chlamydomonas schloesseri]|uniref:Uncharacterized protein n=1 Tax=Chlamydomonas schloesseri TaxID=2026947 RepID=A0A835WN20_9CHLO|nr:hypothetical protein HYH02_004511 [Chlamydomonas schloesseri]|eukprot:KAG2450672.1 hypothetical protein HYH02_004511 [Chlamydomonas schloesseri]
MAFKTNKSSLFEAGTSQLLLEDDRTGMSSVAQRAMRVRSGSVSGLAPPYERLLAAPALQPTASPSSGGLVPSTSSTGLVPTGAPAVSGLRRDISPARPQLAMRHSISGGVASATATASGSASRAPGPVPYSSFTREEATAAAAAAESVAASMGNAGAPALSSGTQPTPAPGTATTMASAAPGSPLPQRQSALRATRAPPGQLSDVYTESASASGLGGAGSDPLLARPAAPLGASPGRPLVPTTRGASFILPTPAASMPTPSAPSLNVIGAVVPGAMGPPPARVSAYSSPGCAIGGGGTTGAMGFGGGAVQCADPAGDLLAVARGGDLDFPGPSTVAGGAGMAGMGSAGSSLLVTGTALPVPPREPSPGLRRPLSFSRARSTNGAAPSPPASPLRVSAPNVPLPPRNAASPGLRLPAPAGVAKRVSASGGFGFVSAGGSVGSPAANNTGSFSSSGASSPLLQRGAPSLRSRLSAISEGALLAARRNGRAGRIAVLQAEVNAEHDSEADDGTDADDVEDGALDELAIRSDILTPAPSVPLPPAGAQASSIRRALLGSAAIAIDTAPGSALSSLPSKSQQGPSASAALRTVSFSPVVLRDGRGPGSTRREPPPPGSSNSTVAPAAAPPPLPSAAAVRPRSAALNAAAGNSPPVWAWDSSATADGTAAAAPREGGGCGGSVSFRGVEHADDSDQEEGANDVSSSRNTGPSGVKQPPPPQEGPLDWALDDDGPAAAAMEEDVPTAARRRQRFMGSASGGSFYTQKGGGPDGDNEAGDGLIADAATGNSLSADGAEAVAPPPPPQQLTPPPRAAGVESSSSGSGQRSCNAAADTCAGASNVLASRALIMSALQLSQVEAAAAAAGLGPVISEGGGAAGGMMPVNKDLTDPVLDGIDPSRMEIRRHMQRIRMSLNGTCGGPRVGGPRPRLLVSMSGAVDAAAAASGGAAATSASSMPGGSCSANSNGVGGAAPAAPAVARGYSPTAGGHGGSRAVRTAGGEGSPASPPRSALATLLDQALKLPCVGLERLQDPERRLKVIAKLEAAAAEGPASIAKVLCNTRPGGGRWNR